MDYTYEYWLNKLYRLFPSEKISVFWGISIFMLIAVFIFMTISNNKLNGDFFLATLNGKVKEIELKENGYHYKIDTAWYLIKHPIVNQIEVGDFVKKDPNTLHIIVKNSSVTKWDGEVRKNIVFKRVNLK